jgi:thiamine biosynthesis protein ThiC
LILPKITFDRPELNRKQKRKLAKIKKKKQTEWKHKMQRKMEQYQAKIEKRKIMTKNICFSPCETCKLKIANDELNEEIGWLRSELERLRIKNIELSSECEKGQNE